MTSTCLTVTLISSNSKHIPLQHFNTQTDSGKGWNLTESQCWFAMLSICDQPICRSIRLDTVQPSSADKWIVGAQSSYCNMEATTVGDLEMRLHQQEMVWFICWNTIYTNTWCQNKNSRILNSTSSWKEFHTCKLLYVQCPSLVTAHRHAVKRACSRPGSVT